MHASIAIGCQAELRNTHPTASCSGINALIAWAQGQDAGQQLRVREAVIAVADCDPVAELRRHRNQVFDGGDAGKAGFQGIE
ncbi:hypothetical protein ABIF79_005194 [Bradyrhizobium japonicum]